jgi:hypothetical protein
MSNTFGRDILIQAEDPMEAASFYVKELGFERTKSEREPEEKGVRNNKGRA